MAFFHGSAAAFCAAAIDEPSIQHFNLLLIPAKVIVFVKFQAEQNLSIPIDTRHKEFIFEDI